MCRAVRKVEERSVWTDDEPIGRNAAPPRTNDSPVDLDIRNKIDLNVWKVI